MEEVFDNKKITPSIVLPPPTPVHGLSRNQSVRSKLSPTRQVKFTLSTPYPHAQAILADPAVSLGQKDLVQRVATAADDTRKWLNVIDGWFWNGSFAASKHKELVFNKHENHDSPGLSDDQEYWGCLPSSVVENYEAQLDQIHSELEDLDIDDLKERILNIHQGNSRPSSNASTFSVSKLTFLDDYSFFVTKTLLQLLPDLSRLKKHLKVWSTRLTVLHIVPVYLQHLRTVQGRAKHLWAEVEASVPDEESEDIEQNRLAVLRESISNEVGEAGHILDSMLDILEGHDDTLPDSWIDEFENVETDLSNWSVAMEQKIFLLRTRQKMSRYADFPELKGDTNLTVGTVAAGIHVPSKSESLTLTSHTGVASPVENGSKYLDLASEPTRTVITEDNETLQQSSENATRVCDQSPNVNTTRTTAPGLMQDQEETTSINHTPISANAVMTHENPGSAKFSEDKCADQPLDLSSTKSALELDQNIEHVNDESRELHHLSDSQASDHDSASTISELSVSTGDVSSSPPSPVKPIDTGGCLRQSSSPIVPVDQPNQLQPVEENRSFSAGDKTVSEVSRGQKKLPITTNPLSYSSVTTAKTSTSVPAIARAIGLDDVHRAADETSQEISWSAINTDDTVLRYDKEPIQAATPRRSSPTAPDSSMLSVMSGTSVALNFDEDSDADFVVDTPSRPVARLPKPPLNAMMKKRQEKSSLPTIITVTDESLSDTASPDRPIPSIETPSAISSPISPVVPLQQQISSILDAIPTPIRLKSGPAANAPEVKRNRARTPSFGQPRRLLPQSQQPDFTLAPADEIGPRRNNSKEPDIRLYHLIQTGRDKPIKLFIRRVGENGERVMVRVGGGWADLGEYLRIYAEHHGRRAASDGRIEIQPITTTPAIQTRSRQSSLLNSTGRSTPTGRNTPTGRATPGPSEPRITSRPGSALGTPQIPMTDTPQTYQSANSQRSATWNEAGLSGPFAKPKETSAEKKEWIDGIVEQAKKSMGKKVEVGDLGKSGATRRIFFRGRSGTPNGSEE